MRTLLNQYIRTASREARVLMNFYTRYTDPQFLPLSIHFALATEPLLMEQPGADNLLAVSEKKIEAEKEIENAI